MLYVAPFSFDGASNSLVLLLWTAIAAQKARGDGTDDTMQKQVREYCDQKKCSGRFGVWRKKCDKDTEFGPELCTHGYKPREVPGPGRRRLKWTCCMEVQAYFQSSEKNIRCGPNTWLERPMSVDACAVEIKMNSNCSHTFFNHKTDNGNGCGCITDTSIDCSLPSNQQQGDWGSQIYQFHQEPTYPLLAASYVLINDSSSGGPFASCNAAGYVDIETQAECEEAASYLGLPHTTSIFRNDDLPAKCFPEGADHVLFWSSAATAARGDTCGTDSRACICKPGASTACELPSSLAYVSGGRDCSSGGGCLNSNQGYSSLALAWAACGHVSGCGQIMEHSNGNFYLRRSSDPICTRGECLRDYVYQCEVNLWNQYGEDQSKCGNSELVVSDQFECQTNAIVAGHNFYQFSPSPLRCGTWSSCDSPITGTSYPWMIYHRESACVETACTEDGNVDADCCANPILAGCQAGFDVTFGDICGDFGEKRVCCIKKDPECIQSACREKGTVDDDCCANPNDAGCEAGYDISFRSTCSSFGSKNVCCKVPPQIGSKLWCVIIGAQKPTVYDDVESARLALNNDARASFETQRMVCEMTNGVAGDPHRVRAANGVEQHFRENTNGHWNAFWWRMEDIDDMKRRCNSSPTCSRVQSNTSVAEPPPTAPFDPSSPLTSYIDDGSCGPRGDDANEDCNECRFGCSLLFTQLLDNYNVVATINGCNYYEYKVYQCDSALSISVEAIGWHVATNWESCDVTCLGLGGTCSDADLTDTANSETLTRMAFSAAGFTCNSFVAVCQPSHCQQWGAPYLHTSHFSGSTANRDGQAGFCGRGNEVAQCNQSPSDRQHRRLCPCSVTTTKTTSMMITTPTTTTAPTSVLTSTSDGVPAGGITVAVANITAIRSGYTLTVSDGVKSETRTIITLSVNGDGSLAATGTVTVDSAFVNSYPAGANVTVSHACAQLNGNAYADMWANRLIVEQIGCELKFMYKGEVTRGSLNGNTLQVHDWHSGTVQDNGNVKFVDGSKWTKKMRMVFSAFSPQGWCKSASGEVYYQKHNLSLHACEAQCEVDWGCIAIGTYGEPPYESVRCDVWTNNLNANAPADWVSHRAGCSVARRCNQLGAMTSNDIFTGCEVRCDGQSSCFRPEVEADVSTTLSPSQALPAPLETTHPRENPGGETTSFVGIIVAISVVSILLISFLLLAVCSYRFRRRERPRLRSQPTEEEIKTIARRSRGSVSEVDNKDAPWDFFISHTQRNPAAVSLAVETYYFLLGRGYKVWLDVKMKDRSSAGMEHGVRNSKVTLAILTGSRDIHNTDLVGYFSRDLCCQELRWALEFGSFIQPIINVVDKPFITEILAEAPLDLQFLSKIDFIDVNRSDPEYFELGMEKICRILARLDTEEYAIMRLLSLERSTGTLSMERSRDSVVVTTTATTTTTTTIDHNALATIVGNPTAEHQRDRRASQSSASSCGVDAKCRSNAPTRLSL